jgi:hypothetical protein
MTVSLVSGRGGQVLVHAQGAREAFSLGQVRRFGWATRIEGVEQPSNRVLLAA